MENQYFLNRKKAITYVIGNFKGGVGKSKTVEMLAFDSAYFKKRKTLVIDLDPQGNASSVLLNTAGIDKYQKTIFDGILNGNLKDTIIPIFENLDVIVADKSFSEFPKYAYMNYSEEKDQINIIQKLTEPLKYEYDVIYIDVPPTISVYSDNAIFASDFVIIVLQTQTKSLEGANNYIEYMNLLIEKFNIQLEVAGIIPYMMQKTSNVDKAVLELAKNMYGEFLLNSIVHYQERLKMYDVDGISYQYHKNGNVDQWDAKAHAPFLKIIDEVDHHTIAYLEDIPFSQVNEFLRNRN